MKEKVPGVCGFLAIDRVRDQLRIFQIDSNDVEYNHFASLPMGISKVRIHFPKRLIAAGEYVINSNLISSFNTNGRIIDAVYPCLSFELNDFSLGRGNNRQGCFSTILDWEIL